MKDLPHHMKKLNRKIVRSAHREELEVEGFEAAYRKPVTIKQAKKNKKEAQKSQEEHHIPFTQTPDVQNDQKKHRTPQTRYRDHRAPRPK